MRRVLIEDLLMHPLGSGSLPASNPQLPRPALGLDLYAPFSRVGSGGHRDDCIRDAQLAQRGMTNSLDVALSHSTPDEDVFARSGVRTPGGWL